MPSLLSKYRNKKRDSGADDGSSSHKKGASDASFDGSIPSPGTGSGSARGLNSPFMGDKERMSPPRGGSGGTSSSAGGLHTPRQRPPQGHGQVAPIQTPGGGPQGMQGGPQQGGPQGALQAAQGASNAQGNLPAPLAGVVTHKKSFDRPPALTKPPSQPGQLAQLSSGQVTPTQKTAQAQNNGRHPQTPIQAMPVKDRVERVSPSKDRQDPWAEWQIRRACPSARFGHSANNVAAREGELIIMGGIRDMDILDDLWVIDTTSLTGFQVKSEGPYVGPRVGHAALTLGNAYIMIGGDTKIKESDPLDNNLYLLNTSTFKWTVTEPVGPRPSGRYGHSICCIDVRIYIFGGQVDDVFFDDMWMFDLQNLRPPNAKWELIKPSTPPPPPRTNHTVVSFNGKMYLFGGANGDLWYSDTWCFDPLANSWTQLECTGYVPAPCQGHAATIVGDVMYVFGGMSSQGLLIGQLFALKLTTRKWYTFQNLGSGPSPRSGHSLTAYDEDKILVWGGTDQSNTAYVLDVSRISYPPDDEVDNSFESQGEVLVGNEPHSSSHAGAAGASNNRNSIIADTAETHQVTHEKSTPAARNSVIYSRTSWSPRRSLNPSQYESAEDIRGAGGLDDSYNSYDQSENFQRGDLQGDAHEGQGLSEGFDQAQGHYQGHTQGLSQGHPQGLSEGLSQDHAGQPGALGFDDDRSFDGEATPRASAHQGQSQAQAQAYSPTSNGSNVDSKGSPAVTPKQPARVTAVRDSTHGVPGADASTSPGVIKGAIAGAAGAVAGLGAGLGAGIFGSKHDNVSSASSLRDDMPGSWAQTRVESSGSDSEPVNLDQDPFGRDHDRDAAGTSAHSAHSDADNSIQSLHSAQPHAQSSFDGLAPSFEAEAAARKSTESLGYSAPFTVQTASTRGFESPEQRVREVDLGYEQGPSRGLEPQASFVQRPTDFEPRSSSTNLGAGAGAAAGAAAGAVAGVAAYGTRVSSGARTPGSSAGSATAERSVSGSSGLSGPSGPSGSAGSKVPATPGAPGPSPEALRNLEAEFSRVQLDMHKQAEDAAKRIRQLEEERDALRANAGQSQNQGFSSPAAGFSSPARAGIDYMQKYTAAQRDLLAVQEQHTTLQHSHTQVQAELAQHRDENEYLRGTMDQHMQVITRVNTSLEQARATAQAHKDEKDQLRAENETLRRQLEELREAHSANTSDLNRDLGQVLQHWNGYSERAAERANASTSSARDLSSSDGGHYAALYEQQKAAHAETQAQLDAAYTELAQMRQHLESQPDAEDIRQEHSAALRGLQDEHATAVRSLSDSHAATLSELRSSQEDLQNKYRELEESYNGSLEHFESQRRALEMTRDELSRLQHTNAKLQDELSDVRMQLQDPDASTASAHSTNRHAEVVVRGLKARVIILEEERDELRQKVEKLREAALTGL